MQRKTLNRIGVLALLLILITSVFTIISVARTDNDGDPDDLGCALVFDKRDGNNALGKPLHKGTVEDVDLD